MARASRLMLLLALVAVPTRASSQNPRGDAANRVDVIRREGDSRVDILVNGKPFTSYMQPPHVRKPVLYPLRTASGVIVTRGYPLEARPGERVDHPHHVGLWLNYENVNGLDFWNNSDAIPAARAPKMGTIVHESVRQTTSGNGEGSLDVSARWVTPQGNTLLEERTRFVFHAARNLRGIDRITTLTAVDSVAFPDAKDGMLGLRVVRALEQPSTTPEVFTDASGKATSLPVLDNTGVTGKYRSSEGLEGDAVWGTRARWVTLSGTVEHEPVTIAILDHPKNVGFPTYWHARGYGLFAANPLGQSVFSNGRETLNFHLGPGQSTTFRYRILILSGETTTDRIEQQYRAFTR